MTIKKIEKKSEAVEAAVEKKSMPVAKNAAELGSNLRKTDSEKVTVIHGNLVLKENTIFGNSIHVEGNIVGENGMKYDLKVNGNLDVDGSIRARNLDVSGNINARVIDAQGDIDALGSVNTMIINARSINTRRDINTWEIKTHGNITAQKIHVWHIENGGTLNVEEIFHPSLYPGGYY